MAKDITGSGTEEIFFQCSEKLTTKKSQPIVTRDFWLQNLLSIEFYECAWVWEITCRLVTVNPIM